MERFTVDGVKCCEKFKLRIVEVFRGTTANVAILPRYATMLDCNGLNRKSQQKSSITTNTKSTTAFPTSYK